MYGAWKLRVLQRRLHQRLTQSAIILLYHRVTDLPSDPWSLAVTPRHFAEHLEVLRRYGTPLRLDRYVRDREERRLPRRPIIITFDDGYADNLHEAKPILARYDVPATIFVSTDFVGADREWWWDDLDRFLLQPGRLPASLELVIDGQAHRWDLGGDANYAPEDQRQYRRWRLWEQPAPTMRHHLYRELWQLLQPLPAPDRQKVIKELQLWSGRPLNGRPSHRGMTSEEVRALASDGLVEVGSHTVTHAKLSAIPSAAQRREIQQSKWRLEEILGAAVTGFAYPYGSRAMYAATTAALVQEAGYAYACANFPGLVEPTHSRYELPRIRVHDWDGEELARKLDQVVVEGHA
jgi:peptidoglycan/xylan/chitin deacetylase (PgdA/CDA1 family)